MDIYVMNTAGNIIAVIDNYRSLIWTKRYFTSGDFELYLCADKKLLDYLKIDNMLIRDNDDTVMIIEKIQITSDWENGDFLIVSGRSLESLLARRIVWNQTNISTNNPPSAVYSLINENTQSTRTLQGLTVDDTFSMTGSLNVQFTGTNLLEAITTIAKKYGFGFKISKNFVFSCYRRGKVNVIFSQEFDNLISSDYSVDYTNYANCVLVAGEGEGTARKKIAVANNISGRKRREIYVDARDLSTNNGEIGNEEYYAKLSQRGNEKLNECTVITNFESQIEPQATYKYKQDYDLGNIVTTENQYGIRNNPRITEIIESWDENSYTIIPKFEEKEEE